MNSKYKFWIVFSLIVVFIIGLAAGYFGERILVQKRDFQRQGRREKGPRFPSLETMSKELHLTNEQQEAIKQIFRANEGTLKAFETDLHQRLGEIRSKLKSEIEALLAEDQKREFERMIERYISERKKQMEEREKSHSMQNDQGDMK